MYRLLTEAAEIDKAQALLGERIRSASTCTETIELGYQGGGRNVLLHYILPLDFWVGLADSSNRYWNALGLGNPFEGDHTIVAEINPPRSGIDRRISGAFVRDDSGRIHIAHRGRVGGGRKGIGKKPFTSWFKGARETVQDGDRDCEMIVVGCLDDDGLLKNLADFTKSISQFKAQAAHAKLT